jgi:hypothetical protein
VKKKLNYETVSNNAWKQFKFNNKNPDYVKHMEALKFKPGGLAVFNPASAHHRYNSYNIQMKNYVYQINGGKDQTKSALGQLQNQSAADLDQGRDSSAALS